MFPVSYKCLLLTMHVDHTYESHILKLVPHRLPLPRINGESYLMFLS